MRALPIARITARLGAFIRAPARRTHSRKRRIPLAPAGGNVYDGAMTTPFEIFLAAPPGLEPVLAEEAAEAGFPAPRVLEGGVAFDGGWEEVMRANLVLRGATRVLARIGAFRALHLAQLDKRARRFPWGEVLRTDMPVRVDVTSRRSRIYHAGAFVCRALCPEHIEAPSLAFIRSARRQTKERLKQSIADDEVPHEHDGRPALKHNTPQRSRFGGLKLYAADD